ncbi:MAG: glucose-6-phosphate dehydrogenase [Candidatus Korobacteraceae bacterium]
MSSVEISVENVPHLPAPKPVEPCIVVVFGATGDLSRRKLLPALFDLVAGGLLSAPVEVLGVGRSRVELEQFRNTLRDSTERSRDSHRFTPARWKEFARHLHYLSGDLEAPEFYQALRARLNELEAGGAKPNVLFYLSVPASAAPAIIRHLGDSGLARAEKGWTRIIVEKPFGRDLQSARALNQTLLGAFDEEQIFRIDHYLGKQTVQNILVFRFANSLFEPVWNRNYVDFVEITGGETLGVESRAAFYEETGALRDMVANHMLQLLTLTAMEPPVAFDAQNVREQKVQTLRAMLPMSPAEVARRTVRAQYAAGKIGSQQVKGYREEPGVAPGSQTETYAAIEFRVENWRWAGVPFYVRTGKRLARSLTEIAVHLKPTPQALFAAGEKHNIQPNVVMLRIQPDEGISIEFEAKVPGTSMQTATVHMDFCYQREFRAPAPVAYETLLLDAMRGDATLFTRHDEVEAEWRLITPILDAWADKVNELRFYPAGSEGPAEANELLQRNGHAWRSLAGKYLGSCAKLDPTA